MAVFISFSKVLFLEFLNFLLLLPPERWNFPSIMATAVVRSQPAWKVAADQYPFLVFPFCSLQHPPNQIKSLSNL
jgi:hypothetical protein